MGQFAQVFLTAISLALSFNASAGMFDKVPSPSGDYCNDEIHEFMSQRFGLPSSEIKIRRFCGNNWMNFYVWTPMCAGEFVFDALEVASIDCTNPQYGKRVYFLNRVHASGDCVKYLPNEERLH